MINFSTSIYTCIVKRADINICFGFVSDIRYPGVLRGVYCHMRTRQDHVWLEETSRCDRKNRPRLAKSIEDVSLSNTTRCVSSYPADLRFRGHETCLQLRFRYGCRVFGRPDAYQSEERFYLPRVSRMHAHTLSLPFYHSPLFSPFLTRESTTSV